MNAQARNIPTTPTDGTPASSSRCRFCAPSACCCRSSSSRFFRAALFLKFDASIMPAMVCGFAYGPAAGLVCGIVGAIIHGIIMADYWGAIMNVLVIIGYVLPAALIYRKMRTMKGAVLGLAAAVACSIVMAIVGNLAITPIYLNTPVEVVVGMIVPVLVPFNIVKALINSVLTLIVYKSISNLITPKKMQVRGRYGASRNATDRNGALHDRIRKRQVHLRRRGPSSSTA